MRLVTTYIPGPHRAIVWERGAMLIADELSIAAQVSLHARLRDTRTLREAMEALSDVCAASVFDVPDFAAVAVLEDDRIHVGARGGVQVSGESSEGPFEVDGHDAAIWVERHVQGVHTVVMASTFDEGLPLVSGVVGAQGILVSAPDVSDQSGTESADDVAPPQGTTIAPRPQEPSEPAARDMGSRTRWPADPLPAPSNSWGQADDAVAPAEGAAHAAAAQLFDSYFASRPTSTPQVPAWTSASAATDAAPAWGSPAAEPHEQTDDQHTADEESSVEAAPTPDRRAGLLGRTSSEPASDRESSPRPAPSTWRSDAEENPAEQTMVSGIPVVAGRRFSGQADVEDVPSEADERNFAAQRLTPLRSAPTESAGHFMKAHLGMLAPAYDLDEVDSEDPEFVLAATCAQGHLSPPKASQCAVCGGAIVGEAERVHRPSLGNITVSTGQVIELTQSLIVGRDPHARLLDGQIPRLLVLPYPHVTASHVEIRLDGWQVSAKDLHSRNGTYLRRAGEPPVRVPDKPVLLESGDVLDLGQGLSLTFADLPAPR